jgi:hypothetical protein
MQGGEFSLLYHGAIDAIKDGGSDTLSAVLGIILVMRILDKNIEREIGLCAEKILDLIKRNNVTKEKK